jgi:ABC-type multidrug transport system ATPase subunit
VENLLEIDSVQLRFGDRIILSSIYVQSRTGRITGILGRNGCGKSCLLKLIFGEIQTHEKSVRINGNVLLENFRSPNDMRMLPQFTFLPKYLTVIQAFNYFNLSYADFCGLFSEFRDLGNQKIRQLSGGHIRVIETFLILKSDTGFCLLDEPFSHLSPKNVEIFIEIMNQERDRKGIVLTDHMYHYITRISDDIYVIKDCTSYRIDNTGELQKYGYLRQENNR